VSLITLAEADRLAGAITTVEMHRVRRRVVE